MSEASCLFLGFIPLLPHRLNVLLQGLGPVLQDSHLLPGRATVVIKLVQLVVVHLNVTRQVSASALVNTDLFSQLCALHLQLADSVSHLDQLSLLFFDKPVA